MKTWHKVIDPKSGFAVYRASDSRTYASWNPSNGSFSSKMLLGNIPVEVLAKAPKRINVKGDAWGVEVKRSYLEGERPVTHTYATKGAPATVDLAKVKEVEAARGSHVPFAEAKANGWMIPADTNVVNVYQAGYGEGQRKYSEDYVAAVKAEFAAGTPRWGYLVDAMIVELK